MSLFQTVVKFFFVLVVFFLFSCNLQAKGLTPTSPEIVAAVEKAVRFLQTEGPRENRLGGRALICMALVKAGVRENHPFVEQTVKDIQAAIPSDGTVNISDHIYTAGLMVLFLADLGADRYRRELDALRRYLEKNQRTDGAWTYLTSGTADAYPSGDMSMTQYAVMALWTLHQEQFPVSGENIDRIARWLVSVQSPEGGYAYQTTVSDHFKQVSWNGVRLSMTSAGMASVYVCRDLFGLNIPKNDPADKVHEAFAEKPSEDESQTGSIGNFRFTVPVSAFNQVQRRGNLWLERHFYPITSSTEYFFYYLYALERYGAFRELAENKYYESPPWYNKTAEFLLTNQAANGSWSGNIGSQVDTAYAVLFLLRSTRRTFEKIKPPQLFGGGNMIGGRGLPKLTDDIKVQDGQIISLAEIPDSEQLMRRLDELEETDDETLAQLADLPAEEVENLLNKNRAKIKKLVGHEKAEKRFAAVTLLGKSGDVSYVPALIYALTDPDPDVMQAAQDALLRLARLPSKERLPIGEDPNTVRKRDENIKRWKTWYLKINPDAVFEER